MYRPSPSEVTLTKRGFILALVISVAVLGAGFGYVLPALTGSEEPDEGSGETVTTVTTEPTDRAPSEEATSESENRVSGGQTTARSTKRPSTQDATEESVTTTESSDTDDNSVTDPPNDGRPAGGAQVEINGSIGSLSDYPSRSRRLNAVVNPPNTARTAGGA